MDAGLRCSWNWGWLKNDVKIEVKGQEHTFPLSDIFKKINKKGIARCILCCKEINYANKGSHALIAHCKTDVHKNKVFTIATTQSVTSMLPPPSTPSPEVRAGMSSTPQQGPEGIRHRYQAKLPTALANRTANAEVCAGEQNLCPLGSMFPLKTH